VFPGSKAATVILLFLSIVAAFQWCFTEFCQNLLPKFLLNVHVCQIQRSEQELPAFHDMQGSCFYCRQVLFLGLSSAVSMSPQPTPQKRRKALSWAQKSTYRESSDLVSYFSMAFPAVCCPETEAVHMTPVPSPPRGLESPPIGRFGYQKSVVSQKTSPQISSRLPVSLSHGASHFLCREASPVVSSQNPEARPTTPPPRPPKASGRTPERSRPLALRPPKNPRLVGRLRKIFTLSRPCFSPPNRTSRERSQSVPGATLSAGFYPPSARAGASLRRVSPGTLKPPNPRMTSHPLRPATGSPSGGPLGRARRAAPPTSKS
jgi:hypothetical protein